MLKTEWRDSRYVQTMLLFGDDVSEVARWLQDTPREWRASSSTAYHEKAWDNGADWQETLRLARDGWQTGATELYAAAQAIPPARFLAEQRWDIAGERSDVPRHLAGNPACMIRKGKQAKQKPVIHLMINGSGNAGIPAKNFIAYGAALVALVDRIESAGRRVEIDVVYVATGLNHNSCCIGGWKVKQADEHCDLNAIAFSIGHPAAYRRFGFGLWERSRQSWEQPGYGRGRQLTQEDLDNFGCPEAYIIPGISTAAVGRATTEQMMILAVDQINDAAGETIVTLGDDNAY